MVTRGMPRRFPAYAPHMPRIFKEAGHLRSIYGATAGDPSVLTEISISSFGAREAPGSKPQDLNQVRESCIRTSKTETSTFP